MMDFLRRLAPPREGDLSRAVAVLPSRFAGEVPLRSTPAPGEAAGSFDDALPPADAQTPPPRLQRAHPAPAEAVPAVQRTVLHPVPVTAAQPGTGAAAPARHAPPRDPMPPAQPNPPAAKVDGASAPARREAVARGEPAVPPARPRAAASATPAATRPAIAPPIANPLSPRTVAARAQAAEPPRPVIHVTIDRIDVRTPAAPARAPAPAKPRAAAPSVSLADYLRGSARRGGAT